jgi:hemoglobin
MRRLIPITIILLLAGCGGGASQQKDRDFSTSGNRDADQRAEERVSKTQQMRGEGAKEGGVNKNVNPKPSLYDRLGGEKGIGAIVDDWVPRLLADPRVNFERKGIKQGGVLGVGAKEKPWQPDKVQLDQLKKHFVQFFSLSTGGPATYDGLDMKKAHENMKITNPEFDAAVGDLKATLDHLRIPTEQQKELLAVVESTREQIVVER